MASQEGEALGLFIEQHRAQIAVTQSYLALVGNGAGDAEGLQTLADALGGFGGSLHALLQSDRSAQLVGPLGVFKADGLDAFYDFVGVHTLGVVICLQLVKILEAILFKHGLELGHAAFITFKQSHFSRASSYSLRGSIHLTAPSSALKRP